MKSMARKESVSASAGMNLRTSRQTWAAVREAHQSTGLITQGAMSPVIADGQQGLNRRSIRAELLLSCSMASRCQHSPYAKGSAFQRKRCAQEHRGAGMITFSRSGQSELMSQALSNAFGAQQGVKFRTDGVAA